MNGYVRARQAGVVIAAAATAAVVIPSTASGAGETYTVVQCHPQNLGAADAEQRGEARAYSVANRCADAASENAIRIGNRFSASNGSEGSVRWIAPDGTAFVAVRSEAKLRRSSGHYSRVFMADDQGRETDRIAIGDGTPGAFHAESLQGTGKAQFVAALGCDERSGCPVDENAKTWIRGVRMELADYADPVVSASGSLVEGGWRRGEHSLSFNSTDLGSGLVLLDVTVNESTINATDGNCDGVIAGAELASRLVPCSDAVRGNLAPSTASPPFHDGTNTVEVCGTDFAGNQTCDARQVRVDNTAPLCVSQTLRMQRTRS